MQSGMPKVMGMALTTARAALRHLGGPEIGQRLNSQVLGYVSGGTIFLALSALLLWLGIVQP
jgi:hypothetical protein